jgi:hypothetical protein
MSKTAIDEAQIRSKPRDTYLQQQHQFHRLRNREDSSTLLPYPSQLQLPHDIDVPAYKKHLERIKVNFY